METAIWVIAAAGMLNVIVLAVYAWFTLGIWRETQRGALRTEDLARQSRDAHKLQVLVTILNGDHPVLEAAGAPRKWSALWGTKGDEVRALLEAGFPTLWKVIEKNLQEAVESRQLEAEGDPHST